MKLFDNLRSNLRARFSSNKVTATKVIDLLNKGYSLMQISGDIYNIPEIRTAINFIAEKVACVPFRHVREDENGKIVNVRDRLDYVLTKRMNPKQSPQIFWTKAITQTLLHNNCYILPEWDDNGYVKWLHILPFTQAEFGEESGKITITFCGQYKFYYDDIVHLQRFGGTYRQATGNYIQIVNTIQTQAVNDAVTSGRVAALLQVKTALKGTDMLKKLTEFKELFLSAENTTGFGMIGAEYDVHKLDMKINPLNKELLDGVIRVIYNYFGVSPEIINNNANELQYEQFIDNTIKPYVYQIEEELTYKLFTETEIYHYNQVAGQTIDLEISTLSAKTMFFDKMIYNGIISGNEVRKRLGMGWVEGLDSYRTNLNSVDVTKANQYQGVEGGESTNGGNNGNNSGSQAGSQTGGQTGTEGSQSQEGNTV